MADSDLASCLAALRAELPASVLLLAVSKGQPAGRLRQAVALGLRAFGESRLQEAQAKQQALADLGPLDWQYIGRLQANKVRSVLRHFGTIQSIDSPELARRVQRIAAEEDLAPRLLFQVRFRPDPAKGGFSPEELLAHWPELRDLGPARPVGLMTILPLGLPPGERLAVFGECAQLADRLGLEERSMGMSGDWREAVAAGSTCVRLGRTLFGEREGAGAGRI